MKIRFKNPFSSNDGDEPEDEQKGDNEDVIEHDKSEQFEITVRKNQEKPLKPKKKSIFSLSSKRKEDDEKKPNLVKSGNPISKLAYNLLGGKLPGIPEYKQVYEQAGMPLVYEAYLSTGFLVGFIVIIPTFVISFLLESRLYPHSPRAVSLIGSGVLGAVVFASALLLWLCYPILRRRSYKSALENNLAYSFGILGVLASAGMTLDRLFERIATSESNPVLAELAKRFLRNVRLFGLDSESALKEVAKHSPSQAFAEMLDSVAVAYKTTGTIHDLVMFESARLLQEKSDSLRKAIASLAVMAELYITLVVVGPIIFIVMLSIFGLLPSGGLPNPIFLINIIVFLGIPVLSIVFLILLDSVVAKT